MLQLELNEKERALLVDILRSSLEDIRTERVRTDRKDLHAGFLEREHFVEDLIQRLEGQKGQ